MLEKRKLGSPVAPGKWPALKVGGAKVAERRMEEDGVTKEASG
ncbi:hypothetical protein [Cohnella xylanilytica]|nr:hypothetical protein [Cohnella xylanilytica]